MLWGIVAGERYDYKDPRMTSLLKKLVAALRTPLAQPDATWFLPFLANIFPSLELKIDHFAGKPGDIKHFLNQTIQHHIDTFDSNNMRDFIDAYLIEIKVIRHCLLNRWVNLLIKDLYCRRESKDLAFMNLKATSSL